MLVLSLHTLQGESCLWQGGAAHSGEFGCNNYTVISGVKSKTCCRRWRWHDFLHRQRFYATDFDEYNDSTPHKNLQGQNDIDRWNVCRCSGLVTSSLPVNLLDSKHTNLELIGKWKNLEAYEASSDPTFCNRNTWRAMRVILSYLFTFYLHSPICISLSISSISSISIIGGADGTSPSKMRAFANVDPIDVARSIARLNPETTFIVVVSKTFTTAETMLNARTLREWISSSLGLVQCQHFFKYMNRLF
ncbi:unnamed protein product [Prunus brigantina]